MAKIGYYLMGFVSLLFFIYTIFWGLYQPKMITSPEHPVTVNEK